MPRKTSHYGWAHQQARRGVLEGDPVCVHCRRRKATVADHQPALALHRHVAGSNCCQLVPSCQPCSLAQGGSISQRLLRGPALELPEPLEVPEPVGFAVGDAVWDAAPWLDRWRELPPEATWPRLMTAPHPRAVGSYGPAAIEWLADVAGISLRWWQELAQVRELEHDEDGMLIWLDVLLTAARQSGKSIKLRAGATWRLHQADLFGEPQTLLHTAKDLPICNQVQRPARAWAKARDYSVREQNGNEHITEPESGSEWIIRGKGSVYGYPGSYVMVDEAWGVAPEIVDDGLEPTMAERISPQLLLASTAHRKATALFPQRRTAALETLAAPSSTLLLEWSARRGSTIEDRDAWRLASPHWSAGRERLLEARLARVEAGETLDVDETDPVESFLAQYDNIWPITVVPAGAGEALLDMVVWAGLRTSGETPGRMWIAVEDDYGRGAAVAAVAEIGEGRLELDGWTCADRDAAVADAELLARRHPSPTTLIVGASLTVGRRNVERAGTQETRFGLPLLRQLVSAGRVLHDDTPDLDEQLATVRVRQVSGGLALVAGTRADIVRAAVWALRAAVVRTPLPAIH